MILFTCKPWATCKRAPMRASTKGESRFQAVLRGERDRDERVAHAIAQASIVVRVERHSRMMRDGFKQLCVSHGFRPSQYASANTGVVGADLCNQILWKLYTRIRPRIGIQVVPGKGKFLHACRN